MSAGGALLRCEEAEQVAQGAGAENAGRVDAQEELDRRFHQKRFLAGRPDRDCARNGDYQVCFCEKKCQVSMRRKPSTTGLVV